jgi:hypothetical protein
MRSSKLIGLLGLFLAVIAVATAALQDRWEYKTKIFTCDEPRTYNLKHPLFPFPLFEYPSALEIYLGGWIEQGSITVKGFPQRTPPDDNGYEFQLIADEAHRDVARAYIGEWYGSPIKLTPSEDAQCYIKLVYKVR